MILKWVKLGACGAVGMCLLGGLLFGKDLASYVSTSAQSVRTAVKDSVPIEFELQRATDMLDKIVPEMHANIRLIAQEEVEVAALKSDIARSSKRLVDEQGRLRTLRTMLAARQVKYTVNGAAYTHDQLTEQLGRRFDGLKEAEVILAGKERLLTTREKSLAAAMQMLDRTRSQKVRLADQIQALEGQYRLVKAASVGSQMRLDGSKLAQTAKLIRQIKKRLDVAERVLAHEARFVQHVAIETPDREDLLEQVDDYLAGVNGPAVEIDEGPSELGLARRE